MKFLLLYVSLIISSIIGAFWGLDFRVAFTAIGFCMLGYFYHKFTPDDIFE